METIYFFFSDAVSLTRGIGFISFAISICNKNPDIAAVITYSIPSLIRFMDYFELSGDLGRLSKKTVFAYVAEQL
jgi:hypothetical protein